MDDTIDIESSAESYALCQLKFYHHEEYVRYYNTWLDIKSSETGEKFDSLKIRDIFETMDR